MEKDSYSFYSKKILFLNETFFKLLHIHEKWLPSCKTPNYADISFSVSTATCYNLFCTRNQKYDKKSKQNILDILCHDSITPLLFEDK